MLNDGEFTVFPKNAKDTKTIKYIKITKIHKHPKRPIERTDKGMIFRDP